VTLNEVERELLRSLPDELRGLYTGADTTDPVRTRLFPRAYLDPTAEDAEQEWRDLVEPELVRGRLAALEQLSASLDAVAPDKRDMVVVDLSPEEEQAWLAVINDARLAIGTRLGVTEDTEYEGLDPDDPKSSALAAYAWLTYLQGELVEALLGELPD
jgi:cell wall assembly regulator SMI1